MHPDQMPHSAASNLGLHSLQRPICPNTECIRILKIESCWIIILLFSDGVPMLKDWKRSKDILNLQEQKSFSVLR